MINDELKKLKEYYSDVTLENEQVDELWMQLSNRLPDKQDTAHRFSPSFAMASLVVIVALGISFQLVSAAQPTSALYPIRLLADNMGAKVTGNYDKVLEKRTEDIIEAAKKNSTSEVKEAAKAYSDSLNTVNTASPSSEKKESVREALRRSAQKLKTVTPANPKAQTIIEDTIKSTNQPVQDVRGANNLNRGSNSAEEHRQENENSNNGQSGKGK